MTQPTNTDELLRQEFEEWFSANYPDPVPIECIDEWRVFRSNQFSAYQACNAKRQKEMARDKALLRECWKAHAKVEEALKQAGYGNE